MRIRLFAAAANVLAALACAGCMLGTQYFNSHAVTKKDADAYDDMNPLGISGCKAKRAQPGQPVFDIHCRCGGGGSSEGCLETEVDTVEKGFDDYASRVCKTEGKASYAIEKQEKKAHLEDNLDDDGNVETQYAVDDATIRCK
jgi:hypothetical protein